MYTWQSHCCLYLQLHDGINNRVHSSRGLTYENLKSYGTCHTTVHTKVAVSSPIVFGAHEILQCQVAHNRKNGLQLPILNLGL